MITMKRALVAIGLFCGLFQSETDAYWYGCSRLYHDKMNVLVDIGFDCHIDRPGAVCYHCNKLSYDQLKQLVWPTEASFMTYLENLDNTTQVPVDLVWESYKGRDAHRAVLLGAEAVVENHFSRLNFIHADTWRSQFENRLLRSTQWADPTPISDATRAKILQSWGSNTLAVYEALAARVRRDLEFYKDIQHGDPALKLLFAPIFEDFMNSHNPFHEIADIEMLGHILSSSKSHVITYAGGNHSRRIRAFLLAHGFRELDFYEQPRVGEYPSEMPVGKLHSMLDAPTPLLNPRGTGYGQAPSAPQVRPTKQYQQQAPQRMPAAVPSVTQRAPATAFQGQTKPKVVQSARQSAAPQPQPARAAARQENKPQATQPKVQTQQPVRQYSAPPAAKAPPVQNKPAVVQPVQQAQAQPAAVQAAMAKVRTASIFQMAVDLEKAKNKK